MWFIVIQKTTLYSYSIYLRAGTHLTEGRVLVSCFLFVPSILFS